MAYELGIFKDATLRASFIDYLVTEQWPQSNRTFGRLWDYYANPMSETITTDAGSADSRRGYIQAQEVGLPSRITGTVYPVGADAGFGKDLRDIQRKEVIFPNPIEETIETQ